MVSTITKKKIENEYLSIVPTVISLLKVRQSYPCICYVVEKENNETTY